MYNQINNFMKKQLMKILFALLMLCCVSGVNAQNLVSTKNATSPNDCNGSATLSANAKFKSWTWKKDSTQVLQQNTITVDALCAGLYTLEYVDSLDKKGMYRFDIGVNQTNNCANFSAFVSKMKPNEKSAGNSGCNGTMEVSVNGGTAPYSFTWSNLPNNKSNFASGLCGGNYNGYVKDSLGCTAQFQGFVRDTTMNGGGTGNCGNFSAYVSKLKPNEKSSANSGCNGTMEVSVNGGTAPYTFTWSNLPNNKSNFASGLCGGNYNGYVKDSLGCTAQFQGSVRDTMMTNGGGNNGKPCQVELKGQPTDSTGLNFRLSYVTRVDNNGTVKTYELKIDGKVVSNDTVYFAKMTKGKHIIEYMITTSIGCEDKHIDTMDFPHFDNNGGGSTDCKNLHVELVKKQNNKQGSTNCIGMLEVKAIGGSAPYTFRWNNNTTAPVATGLCPGKYEVEVKDSNNCRTIGTYVVVNDSVVGTNPCKDFKVELVKAINDKSKDSLCTGFIEVRAVGGVAPYNFLWNNGAKTPFNEKLCAGTYTLNVKDGSNCYATFTYQIGQDSVVTNNPCQGFKLEVAKVQNDLKGDSICTGRIEVRVIGGLAPFNYTWNTGAKTNILEKVCKGAYTVTVKDANNCSAYVSQIVGQDSIPSTTNDCAGFLLNIGGVKNDIKGDSACTGAMYATIVGGKQPYIYYWSNGSKDLFINNVCAGVYTLKAIDAAGCVTTITKEIKQDSLVNVNTCATLVANVLVKNDQVSTTGGCNGALEVSVAGGKAPYTYNWSTSSKDKAIKSLCEGKYYVTVTDANKCVVRVDKYVGRDSIVINPCAGLFANAYTKNDQAGDNVCTGVVVANVGGGKAPYSFKWSDGSSLPYLKNACSGSYNVTIVDSLGCSVSLEKYVGVDSVANPCKDFYAKISGFENSGINAANCNGSLTATVVGGKAPYDFTWNNGAKSPSVTGLCPGEYTLEVKDANKCAITLNGKVFIDSLKNRCDGFYTKVSAVTNDKAGDNACTGEIKTETFGGKAPYVYNWSNGAKTANINNVCSGKYALYVKDANSCIFQLDKFVGSDSIVDPCKNFYAYISNVVDDSEDNTTCLGKLEVTAKGGVAPYTYSWSNGETSAIASNLCEDGYTVKILDSKGCIIALNAKVRKLPSKKATLKAVVHTADATSANACDGAMKVEILSGNAPYNFYHSNGEVGEYRTGICPGVYTVYVKDAKGEVVQLTYLISAPTNTIKVDKPELKDSIVKDTVKGSVTKDCSINYNAIDSVRIKDYKVLKADSVLVTWAVFTEGRVIYVTDVYVFAKGKGVYSLKLDLFCNEQKEIGNFLSASEAISFQEETTASIKENVIESLNVNVYPNPFSDKFTVTLDKVQDYTIHVVDLSGKVLSSNTFANTNAINMDLGHLAEGQYILKIVSETASFTRMIAK
jgi:hypothetical protein